MDHHYNLILFHPSIYPSTHQGKILVRLTKTIPVNHKYIFSVIATAVDQFGNKVNVAMYAKTWEEVDIGQIYICHHLQIDKIKNRHLNHLRTLPITNFKHTDAF